MHLVNLKAKPNSFHDVFSKIQHTFSKMGLGSFPFTSICLQRNQGGLQNVLDYKKSFEMSSSISHLNVSLQDISTQKIGIGNSLIKKVSLT